MKHFIPVLILFLSFNLYSENLKAQKGILDLTSWNFTEKGNYKIEGDFEFYWKKLLTPDDFSKIVDEKPYLALVPSAWNDFEIEGTKIGRDGYGTYRLKLRFHQKYALQLFGLKIPHLATSYNFWINGKLTAANGIVGASKESAKAQYLAQIVNFQIPADGNVEFIFQISNYSHRLGGFWEKCILGKYEQVQKLRDKDVFYDSFLFGSLLIMAIYHFGLFVLRRDDKAALYFGIYCLIIAIRLLFSGENWITQLFPNFPWDWQVRIDYATFYLSVPIFGGFLQTLYPNEIKKIPVRLNMVLGILFSIANIVSPRPYFTYYLFYYEIFVLAMIIYLLYSIVVAIINKRDGALSVLTGALILSATVINDILNTQEIVKTTYLAPIGLFIFQFSQSFILSLIFSKAYQAVQNLSESLKLTNEANSKFVPNEFLSILNKKAITDVSLGDQTLKSMTIYFSDIRSFTTISESMTPKENFDFINSYLHFSGPIIRKNGGYIDKYIGDGIMALFPDDPDGALRAAVETMDELYGFNEKRKAKGFPIIRIGIGIHSGNLMVGVIGEEKRYDFTVISDSVNLASRIEGLTKVFGVSILISEEFYNKIQNKKDFKFRTAGRVKVKGKNHPVVIYEVLNGTSKRIMDLKLQTKEKFEKGIECYLKKNFDDAKVNFHEVLQIDPHDQAAEYYLRRSVLFDEKGVPEDWEGVQKVA
ncbi:MAG: adenylate/guanylate cyclase domain-containing protein [Leptospiraceae bacterium]|nr:adenylate/guanylate cyclase domain-containing protein [Leptospiraceae bacterium]